MYNNNKILLKGLIMLHFSHNLAIDLLSPFNYKKTYIIKSTAILMQAKFFYGLSGDSGVGSSPLISPSPSCSPSSFFSSSDGSFSGFSLS